MRSFLLWAHSILFLNIFALGMANESYASCVGPSLENYSRGVYEVRGVETASLPCRDSRTSAISSQKGPGCYLNVRKLDATEHDLNQKVEFVAYTVSDKCKAKIGEAIKAHFTSWCCLEFEIPTKECGTINEKTPHCFDGKFKEIKDRDLADKMILKLKELKLRNRSKSSVDK